jgi:hypothetical protein
MFSLLGFHNSLLGEESIERQAFLVHSGAPQIMFATFTAMNATAVKR